MVFTDLGDDLLANNRLGQIYYWDTSGGENQRAILVSSLCRLITVFQHQNRILSISFPDRHLVVAGTNSLSDGVFDPMLVRFSDQEDFTNFTVTASNTCR